MQIEHFTTLDAWLQARLDGYGIGASTVGAILGASTYRTPWDVWATFHAPDALPAKPAGQLRRGQLLEPHLLGNLVGEYGEHVEISHCDQALVYHPDHAWARCSPDGFVTDRETGKHLGLIEIKTIRNGWDWKDAPDEITDASELDLLPSLSYGLQCYWQMLICDLPWVDLVAVILSNDAASICDALALSHPESLGVVAQQLSTSKRIRIHRDQTFLATLGNKVAAWRDRHLVNGQEPEASGQAASAYHGKQVKHGHVTVDDDHPVLALADCLFHARDAKRVLDKRVRDYTGKLKQALQHVQAVDASRGVVRWRKHGRGMTLSLNDWVPSAAPAEPDSVPVIQPHNQGETHDRSSETA